MKSTAYKELKSKYNEIISRNNRSRTKSPVSSRVSINNFNKQIEIYEKERDYLKTKVSTITLKHEIDIGAKVKSLEEKLALLVKENFRLNSLGNYTLPPISPKNNESEEDIQREKKTIEKNISGIEEKIKNQTQKIQTDKEKLEELEKNYESLKEEAGEVKVDSLKGKASELQKKLKILMNSWKSNVLRMENIIKEKEIEAKTYEDKITTTKSRIFKQSQQRRLLDMSHDDYNSMMEEKSIVTNPLDGHHLDVGFLYKPSINALYST